MSYLPEVLVRVKKQDVLTACFVQGDDLAAVLSDVRITWGPFARRLALLPQADQDEIDLAIAKVGDLYCAKMRAAGKL